MPSGESSLAAQGKWGAALRSQPFTSSCGLLDASAQPGATSWLDTELVFPPSPGAGGEGAGAGRSESLPSRSAQCRGRVEDDKQGPWSLEFLRDLRARNAFGDDWVSPSLFIGEEPGTWRRGSLV